MRTFRHTSFAFGKIARVKFNTAAAVLTMASGEARRYWFGSFSHIFTFTQ